MGVEAGGHTENHEERWTQNTKTKKIDEWEINNIIQAKVKTAEITLESDVSDQIGHTGSISRFLIITVAIAFKSAKQHF